jgi:hypothetical protein
MFGAYVVVILAGIVVYLIIGLGHF